MTMDVDLGWHDVLQRARRGRTRRLAVALAVSVLTIGAGSAVAVVLTRPAYATLPPQAVQARSMVILEPASGRILLEIAPWRGHPGVCYVALRRIAGCMRTAHRHGTVFLTPPRVLITFDSRAVAVAGRRVHLYRFPRYRVAFALPPRGVCNVQLLDRHHRVITSVHLGCR